MKSMGGIATAQSLQKWIVERRREHNLSQNNFGTTNAIFHVEEPQRKPDPVESSQGDIKGLWNRFTIDSSPRSPNCP